MYILIISYYLFTTNFAVSVESAYPAQKVTPVVLELAILLDNQTGYYRNYDRQSSLEEWSAIFRDVSTFFSSIDTVQIPFRITSLDVVGTETREMKSIYYDKATTTWKPDLCESYGKTRPEFDIALMICGSKIMEMEKYISPCKGQKLVVAKASLPGCKPEELIFNVADAIGEIFALVVRDNVAHCHSLRPTNAEQQNQLVSYFECVMKQYVLYQNAANPNKINSRNTPPVLDPDFDDIIISQTVEEECQRMQNSSDAKIIPPEYIGDSDHNKCGKVLCWSKQKQQTVYFVPTENTVCGNGKRCFHRKCMEAGSLLINMGSGRCLQNESRFSRSDSPTFSECPRSSLHTDRWRVIELEHQNIRCKVLVMSYINEVFKVIQDKYLGVSPIHKIFRFEPSDSQKFGRLCWKFEKLENDEFLIVHEGSGECIKNQGGEPVLSKSCDKQDASVRWKFGDVFPEAAVCNNKNKNDRNCKATTDLKLNASIIQTSLSNEVIVRVNISNVGMAAAVTPGALITWPNILTLVQEAKRCFFMYDRSNHTCYKCKLGRVLQQNESAELINLTFDFSVNGSPLKEISFTLVPTSASVLGNIRNTTISFRPRIVHPIHVTSGRRSLLHSKKLSTSTAKDGLQNLLLTDALHKSSSSNLLIIIFTVSSSIIGAVIIILYLIKRKKRHLQLQNKSRRRRTIFGKRRSSEPVHEEFVLSRDVSREHDGLVQRSYIKVSLLNLGELEY